VLFIPAYVDGLPYTSASVRFRAQWPAKYWPGADVYPNCSLPFAQYDAYVFQKAYLIDTTRHWMHALRAKGKLLAFDLCDADWEQSETHERRLLDALDLCDFATCPTVALEKWLGQWLPSHWIPDRHDLAEYERLDSAGFDALLARRREISPQERCIWFGYSHNLAELDHIWGDLVEVLDRHDLRLTVLSDTLPDGWDTRTWSNGRRPEFVEWTREGANAVIAEHDFALVPQRSPYKSDNRTGTAWLLGVEPIENAQSLAFRLEDVRAKALRFDGLWYNYDSAFTEYDVHESSEWWQALVAQYLDARDGTAYEQAVIEEQATRRWMGKVLPIPAVRSAPRRTRSMA